MYIDDKVQTDKTNATVTYDGKEHTVTFKIEIDGTTLEAGKAYTVTGGTAGTALGNYDFTIAGMGDYAGNWMGSWKIVASPVTSGSFAPTYSITAPIADNGTVTVSRKTPARAPL